MPVDPTSPRVLVSVPDEFEAAQIVHILAEHGIRATQTGGYTSGFRAEAPGQVSVIVRQADVVRAEKTLAEKPSERPEIDWSAVDFQEDQPSADQEDQLVGPDAEVESRCAQTGSQHRPRRFQVSVRTLLVLQTVVCVTLAIFFGPYQGLWGAIVVVLATFALTIAGTVQIASDLTRARQAWRYGGQALFVGLIVIGLLLLISDLL